ncbi:MAG: PACE efflux transporter [Oleispira sp.]|nr:PACE efflux transporter [Oleispira sp.]MBL4881782.1 PACE efflux transporter [Oleispira sp.]
MSLKERVFHTVLFEVIALLLLTLLAVMVTGNDIAKMSGLAISLSMIAMVWNFVFNILFDKLYGEERSSRTLGLRIQHGLGFELGMLVFSFPVIMWMLQLDLLTVFIMDIGAMIFFLLYAIAFNWIYDITRARYVAVNTSNAV